MPTDDPRLEQALHAAAPAVSTTGVVGNVTRRRSRRRRNRRIGAGALALAVLVVVGAVTVLVAGDDGSSPHVAAPGTGLEARITTGRHPVGAGAGTTVTPGRVPLDGEAGLLRAPVLVGTTELSAASYDPGAGPTPSHVVRIEGDHVRDVVNLKAHVLSIAEGEGARWVLTQNLRPTGGRVPDAFLKRVGTDGVPVSEQLPQNADPVGPIAAVGGAVWVPLRDGVLQYDPNGALVREIPLPDADHRWVAQVGTLAAVTDGTGLRSLPSTGTATDTIAFGRDVLGLASAGSTSRVLLAGAGNGAQHAGVARADSGSPVRYTAILPDGFVADGLAASTTRVWATGTVDGAPAIVLLGDAGVRATVVLENASPSTVLVWTSVHTVRAVSDGQLYEIALP